MSEHVRKTTGCLLAVLSILLCVIPFFLSFEKGSIRFSSRNKSTPILALIPEEQGGMIRVNDADAEELQKLPGIGETISALIVSERETNGRFYYPEDLAAVKGIGPRTIEKFRSMLDLSLDESGE